MARFFFISRTSSDKSLAIELAKQKIDFIFIFIIFWIFFNKDDA